MKKKAVFAISLIALMAVKAYALEASDPIVSVQNCVVTPQIWGANAPIFFSPTSELRKKTGSSVFLNGQNIIVTGRVFDQKCVPLSNATVKIWQWNMGSENPKISGKDLTGSTVTDNLGNFTFYTIMPKAEECQDAKIAIHISHKDLLDFETQMMFSNNITDKEILNSIELAARKLLIAKCLNCKEKDSKILQYNFQITVEGEAVYREY